MKKIDDIIRIATKRIIDKYFFLKVYGGTPVYRERVYCYELYHQMRCYDSIDVNLYLMGEIDKGGHPKIEECAKGLKPDFLIHEPGSGNNYAVIEVKSVEGLKRRLYNRNVPPQYAYEKDIESLSCFVDKMGYQRGIYLIYGNNNENWITKVKESLTLHGSKKIELWLHKGVDQEALMIYPPQKSTQSNGEV